MLPLSVLLIPPVGLPWQGGSTQCVMSSVTLAPERQTNQPETRPLPLGTYWLGRNVQTMGSGQYLIHLSSSRAPGLEQELNRCDDKLKNCVLSSTEPSCHCCWKEFFGSPTLWGTPHLQPWLISFCSIFLICPSLLCWVIPRVSILMDKVAQPVEKH